ncbi:MAG: hypothetical protein NTX50_30980 [Candidatus Sumerlaeota bacterium]|nr:hypothetical protein [Candidatus Sumerlaeota bacterium]
MSEQIDIIGKPIVQLSPKEAFDALTAGWKDSLLSDPFFAKGIIQAAKMQVLQKQFFDAYGNKNISFEIDEVKTELDEKEKLRIENETLKTQLIGERRGNTSLRREKERLQETHDDLLKLNLTQADIIRTQEKAIEAKANGRVKLHATYPGEVKEIVGEEILVVYETSNGPIEQIYCRSQFTDGVLPEPGQSVETHVILSVGPMKKKDYSQLKDIEAYDFKAFREKRISGRIEI